MEPAPAWDGGRSSPAAVGRGARGPACASLLPGGCAPGRQGPRLPPRPAEAPGSVKRPLAPRGRRAPPGAPVAAARWAWPCRPSRPNLLPSTFLLCSCLRDPPQTQIWPSLFPVESSYHLSALEPCPGVTQGREVTVTREGCLSVRFILEFSPQFPECGTLPSS